MQQRRSISVPVAGGELSVEVSGASPERSNGSVVFLHDLAANSVSWRSVTSRLDPATTALAPDLRGRAASGELPEPFGIDAHVADVIAVLDHTGAGSCVLVGHGTGASIATSMAERHPDRVHGCVLIDGGVPIRVIGDHAVVIDAALLPLLQRLRTVYPDRDTALLAARARGMSTGTADDVFVATVLHDLGGTPPQVRSRTNESAVWFDGSELLLDPAKSSAIERIGVPVEVLSVAAWARPVVADDVVLGDPLELERRHAHVAAAIVPGVDHDGLLLHPQGADAVRRCVDRVMARATRRPN
ncbi:MAG: alpha/beta hydrolase [Acidimicrobiales bacterium]